MNLDQALAYLKYEAARFRSGSGGYGGNSPQALNFAKAIDIVVNEMTKYSGPIEEVLKEMIK